MFSDAESLVNGELSNFEYVVSFVICHEVLYRINLVSKKLWSKNMFLDIVMQNIKRLVVYFERVYMCY